MRKLTLLLAVVTALILVSFSSPAMADSPNSGCPEGWSFALAVSPDAQSRDRNGDGLVCYKFVNGQGNGDYLVPNSNVKDNNNP